MECTDAKRVNQSKYSYGIPSNWNTVLRLFLSYKNHFFLCFFFTWFVLSFFFFFTICTLHAEPFSRGSSRSYKRPCRRTKDWTVGTQAELGKIWHYSRLQTRGKLTLANKLWLIHVSRYLHTRRGLYTNFSIIGERSAEVTCNIGDTSQYVGLQKTSALAWV